MIIGLIECFDIEGQHAYWEKTYIFGRSIDYYCNANVKRKDKNVKIMREENVPGYICIDSGGSTCSWSCNTW